MNSTTNLVFTDDQYDKIKSHLFPGDGLEALSVCLATPIVHEDGTRFIVTDVYNIPHEACERRADLLTWSTSDIVDILDRAESESKSVVKIHSHPGGLNAFSRQDDRSDEGLFPSIYQWCDSDVMHLSVVFTDDEIVARAVDRQNRMQFIDNVWVVGPVLRFFPRRKKQIAGAFDVSTYEVFKKIKIGFVGCSGTGTWITELAGRNEFGVISICEFDALESKNLNRLLNSKERLVGKNKARIMKDAIAEMNLGSLVRISERPIQTEESVRLLRGCDILVGCVDSVFARHILNLIATYYMIPYFDVGVHIAASDDKIMSAVGGWDYISPGHSSLQSRGIFTAAELAQDTFHAVSPQHFARLKQDGYIRGKSVSRPAVSAINGIAAVACFEEIQARLLKYRNEVNEQFASKVTCVKENEVFCKFEKSYPVDDLLRKKVGRADKFFEHESHLLIHENIEGKNEVLETAT